MGLCAQVLLKAGANIEACTSDGSVPITYATLSNVDTLQVLIDAGADKSKLSASFEGRSLLHQVALDGHVEMVKSMLAAGAIDPNFQVRTNALHLRGFII